MINIYFCSLIPKYKRQPLYMYTHVLAHLFHTSVLFQWLLLLLDGAFRRSYDLILCLSIIRIVIAHSGTIIYLIYIINLLTYLVGHYNPLVRITTLFLTPQFWCLLILLTSRGGLKFLGIR